MKPAPGSVRAFDRERLNDDTTILKLWVVFCRAHSALGEQDGKNLSLHGITRGEFGVLDALYFKGDLLLGQLRRSLLVTSGGVTFLVDRLENRGLVMRLRSPEDRRAVIASLTEEGKLFFERIFPIHVRGLRSALSGLHESERDDLLRLLKKLGTSAASGLNDS